MKNTNFLKLLVLFIGMLFTAFLVFGCSPPNDTLPLASTPTPTRAASSSGLPASPRPRPAPTATAFPPTPTLSPVRNLPSPTPTNPPTPTAAVRAVTILLDDFKTQPYPGESVYRFNCLGGERRAENDGTTLTWGQGVVTTTIISDTPWGGAWMSLNHPIQDELPVNFSAVLPPQIAPAYQSQITGVMAVIADGKPGKTLRLELKEGGELRWSNEITLNGGRQLASFDLPPLKNINELLWVLDHTSPGDYVVLERVSFTAVTPITDTAMAAFVWSYGMLLNNWDPTTGLARDKARHAAGEFDAVQATGALAGATAMAEQLGVVSRADAIRIVNKISDTLLLDLPRYHGLWPHFVTVSPAGEIAIAPGVEWSSVDTAIAALALLDAQNALGLDTSGTEQMLKAVDWNDLLTQNGISHGYAHTGDRFPYGWDVFGGESWLVDLAYAAAAGEVAPMSYLTPPTANGSGFIDEMAWLLAPPPRQDYWGADWAAYRPAAAEAQILYYPAHYPQSCFSRLGLFGLSAGEIPAPSPNPPGSIYQAFGVGGRFAAANDGLALTGAPVVTPHYAGLATSLQPEEAIQMWDWLIKYGYFSPLNNPESLSFPADSACNPADSQRNHLKGSWNLSLQALGWGRYLAQRAGETPVLWRAATENAFLRKGYRLLSLGERVFLR